MSRVIKIWKNPYDYGFACTPRRQIAFQPGLTVLVGCNGSGKTTMIHNIREKLKNDKIPYLYYSNEDMSRDDVGSALFGGNMGLASALMSSSEGECIMLNIQNAVHRICKFIETGEDDTRANRLARAFSRKSEDEEKVVSNERWILFDAIDSGLSIDHIAMLKEGLFQAILECNFGKEIYIVASANTYEMARQERCLDVSTGKQMTIKTYEKYRKVVLDSRALKDKRIYNPRNDAEEDDD